MNAALAPYRDARALVLGATGFIGRWVSQALHDAGAELHVVVRDAERLRTTLPFPAATVACDLGNFTQLASHIHSIQPDVVFNLAGYGISRAERDPQTAVRINAGLVTVLSEAIAAARRTAWSGQALVHVGSALEYGEVGGDLNEGTAPNPTTLYGRTKLQGTRALSADCMRLALPGLTARLFTVYGAGERSERLLPSLMRAATGAERLQLTAGTQRRDFTYVEDVAEGLLRLGLVRADPGSIINLATGRLYSVRRFVEIAAEILGLARDHLEFGALPTRAEEMQHEPVSVARLRACTAWLPPTDIAEGIRRTMERSA